MKRKTIICLLTIFMLTCSFAFASCGGNSDKAFDSSKNITVVAREAASGTKSAFMELLGLKGKKDVSGVIVCTGTAAVLVKVKTNPYAIGYDSLGYVTDDVKIVKVNGVMPTIENIKSGEYKISRPLSIVYKESTLSLPLYNAYYRFLKSAEAQAIIAENGYISSLDNAANYTTVEDLGGEIKISGSTSFEPLMKKLAAKFKELQPAVTVTVGGGGSGTGYINAQGGISDFGMISETFANSKAPDCVNYVVALDGIAVIVNNSNPIESLTTEQLKNIYDCDAGEKAITKWNMLGD